MRKFNNPKFANTPFAALLKDLAAQREHEAREAAKAAEVAAKRAAGAAKGRETQALNRGDLGGAFKARGESVKKLSGPTRVAALPVTARNPRVVIAEDTPGEDVTARLRKLAAAVARRERGARRLFEREVARLPRGVEVGSLLDAAHEAHDAERREARIAAKQAAAGKRAKEDAGFALADAKAASLAYEQALNAKDKAKPAKGCKPRRYCGKCDACFCHGKAKELRQARNRALWKAYFAAKRAAAILQGVKPWEVERFERPTKAQAMRERGPHLVGRAAALLIDCDAIRA